MEVILLESFNKLGNIGDVVNVKDGFARNYLIPQKKALRANKENKDHFTKIKKELIEKNNKVIEEAKESLKKISGEEIVFIRNASDNGQLYGSVSPKDIANYFNEKKIGIKPSNINLHTSIKKIGIYDLNVKLHADVGCNLKINVATSEENAKKQKLESDTTDKDLNESEIINDNMKTDQDNASVATKTEDKIPEETGKNKKTSKDSNNIDSNTNTGKTNEEIKAEKIKNPQIKKTE